MGQKSHDEKQKSRGLKSRSYMIQGTELIRFTEKRPCKLWHVLLQWQDVRMCSSTASVCGHRFSNPGDKGENTLISFETEWDFTPNITLTLQNKCNNPMIPHIMSTSNATGHGVKLI